MEIAWVCSELDGDACVVRLYLDVDAALGALGPEKANIGVFPHSMFPQNRFVDPKMELGKGAMEAPKPELFSEVYPRMTGTRSTTCSRKATFLRLVWELGRSGETDHVEIIEEFPLSEQYEVGVKVVEYLKSLSIKE